MVNVRVKCRNKILQKEDEKGDLEIEEDKYIIKNVKLFLVSLFGDYHYTNYINIIDNVYFIFLPPDFYIEIPGYIWS